MRLRPHLHPLLAALLLGLLCMLPISPWHRTVPILALWGTSCRLIVLTAATALPIALGLALPAAAGWRVAGFLQARLGDLGSIWPLLLVGATAREASNPLWFPLAFGAALGLRAARITSASLQRQLGEPHATATLAIGASPWRIVRNEFGAVRETLAVGTLQAAVVAAGFDWALAALGTPSPRATLGSLVGPALREGQWSAQLLLGVALQLILFLLLESALNIIGERGSSAAERPRR